MRQLLELLIAVLGFDGSYQAQDPLAKVTERDQLRRSTSLAMVDDLTKVRE